MSIALIIIGLLIFGAAIVLAAVIEKKALLALMALFGVAIFMIGSSLVIIPTGYTGVKTTFGQIDQATVPNGANWKIPFIQSIQKVNNKQQDISFTGQIWSETSERTALYYDGITVTYQINPEMSAWIYSHVSNYKENLITTNLVASAVKSSSKELNSVDATNRGKVEPLVQEKLQEALNKKYGEEVVTINKVTISNTDFEESYNEAIANKQTAQLAYEKQQIENKQKIEAAEAEAKVKTTQAKGEADAAVIKAQGESDANELLNNSLTQKILQQRYLDRWDGALPRVSLADDTDTIIDIGNMASDSETD